MLENFLSSRLDKKVDFFSLSFPLSLLTMKMSYFWRELKRESISI